MTSEQRADHPHADPGDGRQECQTCGKWVWLVTHSCKGVPVTVAARVRATDARAESQAGLTDNERLLIARNIAKPGTPLYAQACDTAERILAARATAESDGLRAAVEAVLDVPAWEGDDWLDWLTDADYESVTRCNCAHCEDDDQWCPMAVRALVERKVEERDEQLRAALDAAEDPQ